MPTVDIYYFVVGGQDYNYFDMLLKLNMNTRLSVYATGEFDSHIGPYKKC
jgi:hypothetical protein